MKVIAIFIGLLVLSGCASRQELAVNDDAKCQSYGLKFGTPEYAQCRQNTEEQRQENRRQALSRIGDAATSFHPVAPGYVVGPNPPIVTQTTMPRNTTCNTVGQTTNCQTY